MNKSISGKRRARKLALQALYQWHMADERLEEIEIQFHAENSMENVDTHYFHQLLHGVEFHLNFLEERILPFLDRPIQEINPIELSVLRLSTFELFHCPELPYKVILDEAVSLTKTYGSQEGYRYVNGVLNNLAKTARENEISSDNG